MPVGRIDRNASGLVLLTNDYEWHTILTHPRYEHSKRYKVQIYNGKPNREKLLALEKGLELPDEARPLLPLLDLEVEQESKVEEIATIKFSLTEGKYRQIRRMFEYVGHPVKSIKRTQFGLVPLDRDLKAGEWRMLTNKEIRRLKGPTILKKPTKHPGDLEQEFDDNRTGQNKGRFEDEKRQRLPAARDERRNRSDDGRDNRRSRNEDDWRDVQTDNSEDWMQETRSSRSSRSSDTRRQDRSRERQGQRQSDNEVQDSEFDMVQNWAEQVDNLRSERASTPRR